MGRKPYLFILSFSDLDVLNFPSAHSAPVGRPDLRILVAEDNPVNQKVIQQLLKRLGYQADLVANGYQVLAALEQTSYDVVFLDIQMPEMDGLTAAREIQQRYPKDRPRLIALTASGLTGDRELCLAAGMDDYLSKPILLDELQQRLQNC
jgi:CheY-like chemotaxis protein